MIAEFLQSHPAVEKVCYGGLSTWNHHLKSGPMKGFGGMMGIVWEEDCVHQCLGNQVELILHTTPQCLSASVPQCLSASNCNPTARKRTWHPSALYACIDRVGRPRGFNHRF